MRTRRARVVPRRTYRPRVLIIGRKWAKRHPMVFSDVSGHRPDDIIVDDPVTEAELAEAGPKLIAAMERIHEMVRARLRAQPPETS